MNKVIISGGGTGGHIFPALSIAHALKKLNPDTEILFVGAEGKMEMEKVPAAGFTIVGLPIAGIKRSLSIDNLFFPIKLIKSLTKANSILKSFKPDIAIGVGGYASGPMLFAASMNGVPTLIQEQNSYPGITNKILSKKATKICVAYENMNQFFEASKIMFTGNPVREDIKDLSNKKSLAAEYFNLSDSLPTLLIVGGSQGARSINKAIYAGLEKLHEAGVQVLWQTGKSFYAEANEKIKLLNTNKIKAYDFISKMDFAYALCDVVVARAGASTVSELCIVKKPSILVPLPTAAEDHQTKNCLALVNREAALLVKDQDANSTLVNEAIALLNNPSKQLELANNIAPLARPDAADTIAKEIVDIITRKNQTRKMTSELANIKYVYLLGVGGIGMSALARYFHATGKVVSGYDKTATPLTLQLEKEGIAIHYDDAVDLIPSEIINSENKSEVLVILTPAIPKDHEEWNYLAEHNYTIVKRSKVLGLLTSGQTTLAVAGTHGKTTTSTMLAHILHSAGKNTSAFLGGISSNFKSNLLVGKPNDKDHRIVVEADEFDRSFLQLFPDIAIITSMDPDHLDIYGNIDEMQHNYRLFAGQVKDNGILVYKKGLSVGDVKAKTFSYSIETNDCDFAGLNIRVENGFYHFDFKSAAYTINDLVLGLPGRHNVENAVAASAVALHCGVSEVDLRAALKSFSGAQRRFEIQVRNENCVYIDDYAHHPTELNAAILSAKELFPTKKITGVFQPHLFTRTRDFADGFAESLSLLDSLIMLDIYPARELPIAGITSQMILDKVYITDKVLVPKNELLNEIKNRKPAVIMTLGAGDIDQFVEPIKHLLN